MYKFVDSCLLLKILWTSLSHSGALSRAKFAQREKGPYVRPRLHVSRDESLDFKRPYVLTQGVRIKRIEFRENLRAFFPQGQSKMSVIMRGLYKAGVHKAAFNCTTKIT